MANPEVIPAVEARVHLGEIMQQAYHQGKRFIVKKSGIEMVAIIPASEYTNLVEERAERFKLLDEIKARLPEASPREVERDIVSAVGAIRNQGKHAPSRPRH